MSPLPSPARMCRGWAPYLAQLGGFFLRKIHEIYDFISLVGLGRGVKIPPSGVREGGIFKGVWVFLSGEIPIEKGIL